MVSVWMAPKLPDLNLKDMFDTTMHILEDPKTMKPGPKTMNPGPEITNRGHETMNPGSKTMKNLFSLVVER